GAGGDDDRFGVDRLTLPASRRDLDLASRANAAAALHALDFVLLEQERDALDVAVNPLVLELHHRGEVELGRSDADSHLAELVACSLVEPGGVEERLGRDAADVKAGAAERLALLDHHPLYPELRRADGAEITAGS